MSSVKSDDLGEYTVVYRVINNVPVAVKVYRAVERRPAQAYYDAKPTNPNVRDAIAVKLDYDGYSEND